MKFRGLFVLLIVLSLSISLWSCRSNNLRLFKETRPAMYTITTVTVSARDEKEASTSIDQVFRELQRLEGLLNYYSKDSEVHAINVNAGKRAVKVSKETLEVLQKAITASELTDGGFDVTMGPVIALWDFKSGKIPDKEQLKQALKKVGYRHIKIDETNQTVFLAKEGMEINLGGIIKGYSAEKAVQLLKSKGLGGAIVSVGGDIRAFGSRPDGKPWSVGIQNPRPVRDKDELIGVLSITNHCVSTSGDYERFFEMDGVRYHHILNPKTGYPSKGIQSLTIISEDAALCDALSTGLFALGLETAVKRMKQLGLEGVIIDSSGKLTLTSKVEEIFRRTM